MDQTVTSSGTSSSFCQDASEPFWLSECKQDEGAMVKTQSVQQLTQECSS